MGPVLATRGERWPCRFAAVALACLLGAGCERAAVGEHCYRAEIVLDEPIVDATDVYPVSTDRGDLAGWILSDQLAEECRYRVVRVLGGQADEVLCIPPSPTGEQRLGVGAWAGEFGGGLYMVITVPPDAHFDSGTILCWDSPGRYELWDLVSGLQATFSSVYGLNWIVRSDRFLGATYPCDATSPDRGVLALVDDTGQVLRQHPGFGHFAWIDPVTRDYFLSNYPSSDALTYQGFDADGQDLALVIDDPVDCSLAGALAGVQAFVCPSGDGGASLIVGRPGGPTASVDLGTDHSDVALGGQGAIVATGLGSGRLSVYHISQGQLELLWEKPLLDATDVYVGQGADPMIAARARDGTLRVFDLQGRPVMDGTSDVHPLVGDVGGFVTLFGERIQTYRITRASVCTASSGS